MPCSVKSKSHSIFKIEWLFDLWTGAVEAVEEKARRARQGIGAPAFLLGSEGEGSEPVSWLLFDWSEIPENMLLHSRGGASGR